MKNEIIIGTVAAVLASAITYFASRANDTLSRVQTKDLAITLRNDDAFTSTLLDDFAKDSRFIPKDGKDGNDGKDGLSDVIPSGAVLSFDLNNCPSGWNEYRPAYGRFIRGIDKSGQNIDPDGMRASGNTQTDEIKEHQHSIAGAKTAGHNPQVGSPHGYASGQYGSTISGTGNVIGVSAGSEVRPKNVALLYCKKS